MNYMFICKKCGDMQELDNEKGTHNLKCNACSMSMSWGNKFPSLNAIDFINTSKRLFESAKNCDKDNLNMLYDLMLKGKDDILKGKYNIDTTSLNAYVNQYEKHLEKYPDNDDTVWFERADSFIDTLCESMDLELSTAIYSVLSMFNKNPFRKPYIIMIASLIEQLFNDYFVEVISLKLSPNGRKVFLKKYETAGVQSVIDIIDSFLDESLKNKMNKYSEGFYDRWASLRQLRNSIIHSNNKYISKIKVSNIDKLIKESYVVFLNLKSELYKNTSTN